MMPTKSGGERDGDTHAPDTRTIHQRLADAYIDIAGSGFEKSEKVQDGYSYIPIAQMLTVVRAAHSKHGIITIFGPVQYDTEQGEKRITKQITNRYGETKTYQVANGHVDVTIYGANGDSIETTVSCEAQDNSDKLTNLLLTNAQRTLYRTLYAIDEGPGFDPEEFNFSVEEKKELTAEKMAEESGRRPKPSQDQSEAEEQRKRENRRKLAEQAKAEEEARKAAKAQKEADAKGAEVTAEEQIGEDKVGEKMAEHYGINIETAKTALIRFHNRHIMDEEPNPVLAKHIEDNDGTFMLNWSTSTIIACYQEMVNRGFIQEGSQ